MNKYLLLSAAAVLATTSANAGTVLYEFQFGSSSGGAYCDGGTVYSNGLPVMSWQHQNNNCSGGVSYGDGSAAKFDGLKGKYALMSDSVYAENYGIFSQYVSVLLPERLKHGKGIYQVWIGMNGTTAFEANAGVITQVNALTHKGKGKSVLADLKALMAAHRTATQRR